MITLIELVIKYKKTRYRLTLDRKIIRVLGESASGKSTLAEALSLANKDTTKIKVKADKEYEVTSVVSPKNPAEYIRNSVDTIFVLDENISNIIMKNDMAKAMVENNSCYFILMGRCNYSGINLDLSDVKRFVEINGETHLENYLRETVKLHEMARIGHCLLEDTGKAREWFEGLFGSKVILESSENGKDGICKKAEEMLNTMNIDKLLLIFDRASFGGCITNLEQLAKVYGRHLAIIANYKSWEYLMLKSNMFKDRFIEYDIMSGVQEEAYYEELLQKLSHGTYSTINHNNSRGLSKCYTESCCSYSKSGRVRECNVGLAGEDKFVALLQETEFAALLEIARRK